MPDTTPYQRLAHRLDALPEGHWQDVLKGSHIRELRPHRRQPRNFHVIAEHWPRAPRGDCGFAGRQMLLR